MRSGSVLRLGVAATIAAGLLLAPAPTRAADDGGPFGVGLVVGSPFGIALKYYLGRSGHAVDFVIGDAVAGARGILVHADYLWHPAVVLRERAFDLPVYVGIGARLLDHDRSRIDGDDDFHVGARVPAGLLFDFKELPLEVFAESALVLDFRVGDERGHGGLGLDLNVGVGGRYYF